MVYEKKKHIWLVTAGTTERSGQQSVEEPLPECEPTVPCSGQRQKQLNNGKVILNLMSANLTDSFEVSRGGEAAGADLCCLGVKLEFQPEQLNSLWTH